ncbi:MAG: BamA/TamA family outer membrane protein [Armatimonadetes bacterium]|nr:BamA/TamA family outer membrane protein [Armatimonadota bacterium]
MLARVASVACLFAIAVVARAQDSGKINEIAIRGNKRVSTVAIKANMKVKEGQLLNLGALKEDCQHIRDMGWFSKVDYTTTPVTNAEGNSWNVTIDVQEYEVVREVAVVGNSAIPTQDILKVVSFKPPVGAKDEDLKPFNNADLGPTAQAIAKLYTDRKLFGLVEGIGPDQQNPETVIIKVKELTVNSVTVKGMTSTRPGVFNHLIKTKPGDAYSPDKWYKDYSRILSTQWFEGVSPTQPSQSDQEEGSVDLVMNLNDARTGLFNAGVVLDPQNSLAGAVSYSDSNFLGSGQTVGFNYTQATAGYGGSVSLDYANPFMDSKDTALRVSVYDRLNFRFSSTFAGTTNTADQYKERRTGMTISATRPVSEKMSFGLSSRYERINTDNPTLSTSVGSVPYVQQDGEVGSFGLTSIMNTRDLDIDPSKGTYLRVDLEPGYSVIRPVTTSPPDLRNVKDGRFGFVKLSFDYRTYYTRNKKPRTPDDISREVFAFRLKGGTETGTVPFFEQYFAGGNDSVRGYSEDRFWGRNSVVATLEWRKPIQEQFSLVTFVDYGGAWGGYAGVAGFEQSAKPTFHYGYGVGIRFRTPLGPIRLDYAFNDQGSSRAHFMIGTSF